MQLTACLPSDLYCAAQSNTLELDLLTASMQRSQQSHTGESVIVISDGKEGKQP